MATNSWQVCGRIFLGRSTRDTYSGALIGTIIVQSAGRCIQILWWPAQLKCLPGAGKLFRRYDEAKSPRGLSAK